MQKETRKWHVPFVEGDTPSWGALGYATITPWKNKLIIVGGENKDGETHRVWVLEKYTLFALQILI